MPVFERGFDPVPPYRPALTSAQAERVPGPYQPAPGRGRLMEALFTDGQWRLVTVRGKMRGTDGWRVLVEWYGGDTMHEDWLMWDRSRLREPFP